MQSRDVFQAQDFLDFRCSWRLFDLLLIFSWADSVAPCRGNSPCRSFPTKETDAFNTKWFWADFTTPISGTDLSQPFRGGEFGFLWLCCDCKRRNKNMVLRLGLQQKWVGFDCERKTWEEGVKMVTRLTARYDYTTECPARWKQTNLLKCHHSFRPAYD